MDNAQAVDVDRGLGFVRDQLVERLEHGGPLQDNCSAQQSRSAIDGLANKGGDAQSRCHALPPIELQVLGVPFLPSVTTKPG